MNQTSDVATDTSEFAEVFQRVQHPYENQNLVLVTGVGRSGTTALRTALCAHPRLHGTNRENNVIYDFLQAGLRNCTLASRRYAMATDDATYRRLLKLYLLNLLWPLPRPATEQVLGIQGFSDLTIDRLQFLREMFPKRKILLILRHGVEVVASRMVYRGFRDQPFDAQCEEWQSGADFAAAVADDDDVLVVRHEQLIAPDQQTSVINDILTFAELPAAAEVHETLTEREFHPTQVEGETRESASDLTKRRERWLLWTEDQRKQFIELCGRGMQQLGYEIPE